MKRSKTHPSNKSNKSKQSSAKSFLDTSTVRKLQSGHAAHQAYLSKNIPLAWYVNDYVKMEYYRTLLLNWVAFYFESAEQKHPTFADCLKYFEEAFGRGPKTTLNCVASMLNDEGFRTSDARDKEACRQKLQDLIFVMAHQFEKAFVNMGQDPTKCARVRHPLKWPETLGRDAALQEFNQIFSDVDECRKRCSVSNLFHALVYKEKMTAIASMSKDAKTEKQIAAVTEAQKNPDKITCHSCGSMGDSIIAASLDANWKLHSMDTLHGLIAKAIHLECEVHPSLKKILSDTPQKS
jgi:hypothetical protein